jgi:hypothetical protein
MFAGIIETSEKDFINRMSTTAVARPVVWARRSGFTFGAIVVGRSALAIRQKV